MRSPLTQPVGVTNKLEQCPDGSASRDGKTFKTALRRT